MACGLCLCWCWCLSGAIGWVGQLDAMPPAQWGPPMFATGMLGPLDRSIRCDVQEPNPPERSKRCFLVTKPSTGLGLDLVVPRSAAAKEHRRHESYTPVVIVQAQSQNEYCGRLTIDISLVSTGTEADRPFSSLPVLHPPFVPPTLSLRCPYLLATTR